jgi:hypothetical protein
MNSVGKYVNGEECLGDGWAPRGVSLVHAYIRASKRPR